MLTFRNFSRAIEILAKYEDPNSIQIAGEPGFLHLGHYRDTRAQMTQEEEEELTKMGFIEWMDAWCIATLR